MEKLKNILEMMSADDPEQRRQAAIALGESGVPDAVPHLIGAVGDLDWRVRKTAVESLLTIGGDEVFEGLYRLLYSGDNAGARNSAAEALIKMGADAARALGERYKEADNDVRKFIVDIIGEIGDRDCAGVLIRALDDKDTNVCTSAIEFLGRMKVKEALGPLVGFLKDGDPWLKFNAAAALGELGDTGAVAPLLEAADDDYLREPALYSLGILADDAAWPALLEALSDRVQVIRELAVKGLSNIYRASGDKPGLREKFMKKSGGGEVDFIIECAGSEDAPLKLAAGHLLGILREKAAVEALSGLLYLEETREAGKSALLEIAADQQQEDQRGHRVEVDLSRAANGVGRAPADR